MAGVPEPAERTALRPSLHGEPVGSRASASPLLDDGLTEPAHAADIAEMKRTAVARMRAAALRTPADVLVDQHRRFAIHEIGHATRMLLLYGSPGYSWIVATPFGGWCGEDPTSRGLESRRDANATAIRALASETDSSTLAGRLLAGVLEILVAGVALEDVIWDSWAHTWASAQDPEALWAAESIAGMDGAVRVRDAAYERVKALFVQLRVATVIDPLIAALLRHSRLPGVEAERLLRSLSGHFGRCPAADYSEVR